jgi:hypothetical protein
VELGKLRKLLGEPPGGWFFLVRTLHLYRLILTVKDVKIRLHWAGWNPASTSQERQLNAPLADGHDFGPNGDSRVGVGAEGHVHNGSDDGHQEFQELQHRDVF